MAHRNYHDHHSDSHSAPSPAIGTSDSHSPPIHFESSSYPAQPLRMSAIFILSGIDSPVDSPHLARFQIEIEFKFHSRRPLPPPIPVHSALFHRLSPSIRLLPDLFRFDPLGEFVLFDSSPSRFDSTVDPLQRRTSYYRKMMTRSDHIEATAR